MFKNKHELKEHETRLKEMAEKICDEIPERVHENLKKHRKFGVHIY
jgi:hypothetical protein